jgi:hypothetical protein
MMLSFQHKVVRKDTKVVINLVICDFQDSYLSKSSLWMYKML